MSVRTAVRTVEVLVTTTPLRDFPHLADDPVWAALIADRVIGLVEFTANRDESWQIGAAWNAGEKAKILGRMP